MIERAFIPGSEWLYFKLYTGPKSSDEIIVDSILPLYEKLISENLITKGFFLRYYDPEFHIRIRFHVDDVVNYGHIFKYFHEYIQPYVDNKLIFLVQCDTYKREMERYSPELISTIEDVFCADSYVIMKLLKYAKENSSNTEEDRWRIALILTDHTLGILGKDISAKKSTTTDMSNNFKNEFGLTSAVYTKQLNDKYRSYRKIVDETMNPRSEFNSVYTSLLKDRGDTLTAIMKDVEYDRDFLFGVLHLDIIRLFRSNNRIYEMIIYDFLKRYYESIEARMKYDKSNKEPLITNS